MELIIKLSSWLPVLIGLVLVFINWNKKRNLKESVLGIIYLIMVTFQAILITFVYHF